MTMTPERHDDHVPVHGPERLVRPYVVTRGRTHGGERELPIETIVVAADPLAALPANLPIEAVVMLRSCTEPLSIIELAASARVPVGVARVLVADLDELGVVRLGRVADVEEQDNVALLERLLDGIRAL
ncbi:MAG: DUF742 domain-containing protein [Actinobacteria bacterium]|nr:DUF742 domain-containing protein [Actinomycetota bacterium]